jgi:hypothetical protein
MNWRLRDKIIEAICTDKPLYIKDTGIKVEVDYFGTDIDRFRSRGKPPIEEVRVTMVNTPTAKALKLFKEWHIKKNSHSKTMELDGVIELKNLSLTPFESKGAKILYAKKK